MGSKPGDIQDAGHPTNKLTLAKTAGGAAIAAAVSQLEASLEAMCDTVIKTGCHYNPEPLLKAFEKYGALLPAEDPNSLNNPKMQFLYRNIGRYQQMMSLGYAHGFCGDGLYENVRRLQKGQTPRESTTVVMWDSVRSVFSHAAGIYSLRGSLGVDFAIDSLGWPVGRNAAPLLEFVTSNLKFMSIKNSRHADPLRSNSETVDLIRQNRPA